MRQSRRSGRSRSRFAFALPRLSLKGAFVGLLAIALGGVVFVVSAARVGVPIAPLRESGAHFYPHLQALDARDAALLARPVRATEAKRHLASSQALLPAAPLSSDLIRSILLGYDLSGQKTKADQLTALSDRLSRRDGFIQLRLAQQKLLGNDAATGVQHIDNFLRTYPVRATDEALARLVAILRFADGRKAMTRYVRTDNPWLERYLGYAAASTPNAGDLAELLFLVGKLPDGPLLRPHFATLFSRLVQQGDYARAIRLYRKLPGADGVVLNDVAVTPASVSGIYQPAVWRLDEGQGYGGTPVMTQTGNGIEFFARPDSFGISGAKLVDLAGRDTPQYLYWSIAERQRNRGATARFKLVCQNGSAIIEASSLDLFTLRAGGLNRMVIPSPCRAVLVQMQMGGGIGQDESRIVIDRLNIRSSPASTVGSNGGR